jgi:hypothetical protein
MPPDFVPHGTRNRDLGALVTCCELAALSLADKGNHVPSDAELGAEVKRWPSAGTFDDRDLSIVLGDMGLGNKLRKLGADYASKYAAVPDRCIK